MAAMRLFPSLNATFEGFDGFSWNTTVSEFLKNSLQQKKPLIQMKKKGLNGHFEIALYVDTFEEVDSEYAKAVEKGAQSVLEPTTEPWVSGHATSPTRKET